PVPGSRRERRRHGFDEGMEPRRHSTIRFWHLAIFASTALSPSALSARGPRRTLAFNSWARSLIAARSWSVNPLDGLPVVLVVGFWVPLASASLPGAFFSDISGSFSVAFPLPNW